MAWVMSRTENLSEEVVGENAAGACLKAQGSMASQGSSSFGRAECEGRNQGHGREGVPTLGCSIHTEAQAGVLASQALPGAERR